jgi:hypothetical protein
MKSLGVLVQDIAKSKNGDYIILLEKVIEIAESIQGE